MNYSSSNLDITEIFCDIDDFCQLSNLEYQRLFTLQEDCFSKLWLMK